MLLDSISDSYGSSRICELVLESIRSQGVSVRCYVGEERRDAGRYAEELRMPLLVMSYLRKRPIGYVLETLRASLRILKRHRALFGESELVYCNTLATLPMALLARLCGRRALVHLHETSASPWMRRVGGLVLRRLAHRTICVSDAVARSWGLEAHPRSSVVRNGIPERTPGSAEPHAPTAMAYDVCFVGRLSAKKGIGTLLDALERMRSAPSGVVDRPLRVGIAGGVVPGSALPAALGAWSNGGGVEVEYLGELPATDEVFERSRIACVPSTFADPYPTVVLEALRAGCVVVASEIGGAKEALEGAAAELVPPVDAAALADALSRQLGSWKPEAAERNRMVFSQRHTYRSFQRRFAAVPEIASLKSGGGSS